MVSVAAWIAIGVAGLVGPTTGPDAGDRERVRAALARGGYPWYDAKDDAVQPVWPPGAGFWEWFSNLRIWVWIGNLRIWKWLGRLFNWSLPSWRGGRLSLGELVVIGLVILALAILLVVLVESWRRYRPSGAAAPAGAPAGINGAGRADGLPAALRPETDDPWAEANRCRQRGDYARAIVCLFAHQLLTLDRIRLLRLVPGRTARQLVRAIEDRRFRGTVEPTLRVFEAVYYGHHTLTAEGFEAVWTHAEAFERHVAAGTPS